MFDSADNALGIKRVCFESVRDVYYDCDIENTLLFRFLRLRLIIPGLGVLDYYRIVK